MKPSAWMLFVVLFGQLGLPVSALAKANPKDTPPEGAEGGLPAHGNVPARIEKLEASCAHRPDDVEMHARLAAYYRHVGAHEKAAAIHKRFITASVRGAGKHHALLAARSLLKAGKRRQAIQLARDHLSGNRPLELALRGLFYESAGIWDKAEEVFLQMAARHARPEGRAQALFRAAQAARKGKALDRARRHAADVLGIKQAERGTRAKARALLRDLGGGEGGK